MSSISDSYQRQREARAALTEGQKVCLFGYGTAATVHRHATVVRTTKTMIIVEYSVRRPYAQDSPVRVTSRYRIADGYSLPRQDYGGTALHLKCQRPRKNNAAKGSAL